MRDRRARGEVAVLAASLVVAGCVAAACLGAPSGSDGSARATPVTGAPQSAQYADERRLCLERTNEFRAERGLRPLAVSARLEAYAREAARHDGRAHLPHD